MVFARTIYIERKDLWGTTPNSGSALCTIIGSHRHRHRQPTSLESRVGVGQELREVRLEPGAGLGGGLEGVRLPAVEVVPGGGRVAGAVRLAAGLDPHEGILDVEASVGGGAEAETSSPGRLS